MFYTHGMKRIVPVLILAFGLAACTADQVTGTLEASVDAAIAGASIADPQYAPYYAIVTACLSDATTELGTTAAPAIKASAISAACASAVAAGKVGGTPVAAISAALSAFLQSVEALSAEIELSKPEFELAFAGKSAKLDHARLKRIEKKVAKLKTLTKGK